MFTLFKTRSYNLTLISSLFADGIQGMHTAVLKEINSTCEYFSKEVILEEFEAYFEVLERSVFHQVLG